MLPQLSRILELYLTNLWLPPELLQSTGLELESGCRQQARQLIQQQSLYVVFVNKKQWWRKIRTYQYLPEFSFSHRVATKKKTAEVAKQRTNFTKLVKWTVRLPACSSPSSSRAGKLGEETRQTFRSCSFFFFLSGSLWSGCRAHSVRFPGSPTTERLVFRRAKGDTKAQLVFRSCAVTGQRCSLLKLRRKTTNCPDTNQAEKTLSL